MITKTAVDCRLIHPSSFEVYLHLKKSVRHGTLSMLGKKAFDHWPWYAQTDLGENLDADLNCLDIQSKTGSQVLKIQKK